MSHQEEPMDRILLALHNLCAVSTELAKTSEELAQTTGMDLNQLEALLKELVSNGYIACSSEKRYYITGTGIIRVCSAFT